MVHEIGVVNYNLWTWTILYGCTIVWSASASIYSFIYGLGDYKHLPEVLRKSRAKAEAEKRARAMAKAAKK
jgi:hypothetical protein